MRAEVNGVELEYELHGDGPPLVLISGTGGDLRRDPNRAKHPYTRTHTVLMYDQRGLGRAAKPDIEYSMADYADDCAALMDHVGFDTADVVGISFGGMVAQHVAIRHPDRVGKLVLACTSSGGAGGASFDLLPLQGLPADERARRMLPVMDTRNDVTTEPYTYAPMMEPIAALMFAEPLNADDQNHAIGARRQLVARAAHDTWDELPAVAAPTFVVGGRYDAQAPPDNLERLTERLPDARMQLFDGGHLFMLQDPTAHQAIIDFLTA